MKGVVVLLVSVFVGFAYGKAWYGFTASHPMPGSLYIGIVGLSLLGGFGLSGRNLLFTLYYGVWMFAGFGLAALL